VNSLKEAGGFISNLFLQLAYNIQIFQPKNGRSKERVAEEILADQ
jgi:hypothetical protein